MNKYVRSNSSLLLFIEKVVSDVRLKYILKSLASSSVNQEEKVTIKEINTGPLVSGVVKVIIHDLNLEECLFSVRDFTNIVNVQTLRKVESDPKNKLEIEVGVDIESGLDIVIIGKQ